MPTTRKRPKRKPDMKGISRIDQPHKKNHGWFVRLTRRGKLYSLFFADKKNGGKTKALALAKKGYAKLLREHPPVKKKK